jgi:alkanesulfonate monooxygenase SsuD/methylene tetrahydromethanopterin reductase-like flavin-dependent oxidoreductase (luciferase family)
MQFHCFHFMPYLHARLDFRDRGQKTMWMLHSHDFDRDKCADLYERYIGEMEFADELGFDGVCVNEHHQTPHSLMPQPNIMAATLAQRVKRARILILGRALPLVANPLRVAEEWAMLDNLTRGRIVCGLVRGIGIEYHASGVTPSESQERFFESHDLIKRAWTDREPFAFEGKHYNFNYVNVFPRTYQTPHPPIWIPSGGNPETIEWAAHPDRRYTYLQFFNNPYDGVKRTLLSYRAAATKWGYEADPSQLGWAMPVYVARTDEEAFAEAAPHIEALFNDFMAFPFEMLMPPGYASLEALRASLSSPKAGARGGGARVSAKELRDQGIALIGSPATVRARLEQAREEIGLGHVLAMLQFATLPADLTHRSIEMFAEHVMAPMRQQEAA